MEHRETMWEESKNACTQTVTKRETESMYSYVTVVRFGRAVRYIGVGVTELCGAG